MIDSISGSWLNFSYSKQDALNDDAVSVNFSYTICVGDTTSFIHFDYSRDVSPAKSPLIVALGTTKPHIGGKWDGSVQRYGSADPTSQGANAFVWGILRLHPDMYPLCALDYVLHYSSATRTRSRALTSWNTR